MLFCFHFSGKAQRLEYAYWETYGQYVPLAVAELGGCVGLDAHDTFWPRSFKIGTAFVSEFVIVKSLKSVIDEERPDGRSNNSFPSGHTATAFNGAELVRYEYGTWYDMNMARGGAWVPTRWQRQWACRECITNDIIYGTWAQERCAVCFQHESVFKPFQKSRKNEILKSKIFRSLLFFHRKTSVSIFQCHFNIVFPIFVERILLFV